jgi:hypothetical protein
MFGGRLRRKPVQPFNEIRVLMFRLTKYAVNTECFVMAEVPEMLKKGWFVYAVDPEDAPAWSYWTELREKDKFRR